jgi:hypothetical protein
MAINIDKSAAYIGTVMNALIPFQAFLSFDLTVCARDLIRL